MKSSIKIAMVSILTILFFNVSHSQSQTVSGKQDTISPPAKLAVLWTSGDREVALNMVFMYTYNTKKVGWWDTVQLIVWGPSAKLLSQDSELQEYVKKMLSVGVEVVACKACSDSYGVSEKLESIGVVVKYMGEPFTKILKSDWKVLTF
jgi:hypothetical protein